MSAIDYILTILILASLYLNWHLVQVCRSAMKARKKALRDAQRLLKRGEEAQEQAIADKRRFLEALGEAFLLIGPSGHIVLANTLAKELFQEEKLEGRKVGALVCNQELLGHVQEAFDTDGPVTKEFTLSAANSPGGVQNGITAWHLDSAITDAPIREKRILLRNITQNYLTNQMRRDFVANASHELRTPLTIIVGYLENLMEDDLVEESPGLARKFIIAGYLEHLMEDDLVEESPGLARKFIGVMHQNSQRLMNIIEDMLMISKLESGHKAILKEQWFRLTSCADDVFSRLDSIREKKQAVLHMDIPTDWELYGDPFYWKQNQFNLVENAIKQNTEPGLSSTANSVQFGGKRPQAKHGAGTFHYCGRRQNTGRLRHHRHGYGRGHSCGKHPLPFQPLLPGGNPPLLGNQGNGPGPFHRETRRGSARRRHHRLQHPPPGNCFYHHHSPEKIPGRKEDTATITGID